MANQTQELIVNHDDGSYYCCSPLAARLSADCSSQCCEHYPELSSSRNYHRAAATRCGQHHQCRHQSGGLQSRICNTTTTTTHVSRRGQPAAAVVVGRSAWLTSSFLINLIVITLLGPASRTMTNTYHFVDALTEMANTEPQFSNYPTTCPLVRSCQCKWSNGKQIANCDRQNLSTIPGQLPPDTQVLEMNGNNLIQLSKNIFQDKHMTNLQKIFLSECKIASISDEAFAQLTNLIELDLSHNNIQQVPTRSFERLNHALRKLSLAHNRIQVIESNSFAALTHLDVLDLSNNHLSHLRPGAFRGLSKLRELKLNDNKLTHLPANVIIDLNYFFTIDLYGNPWHCDCLLHQSIEFMVQNNVQQSIQPTCATPQRVENIRWSNVKAEDYMCPPVLINKQVERMVGAGSNISFECTAHGSHPMTFVWYQDERNLTTNQQVHQSNNNSAGPIQSTKLLEERRYEIVEEKTAPNMTTSILFLFNLQMTDTSLFLCWVENPVGNSMANFSLIVNDSPPAGFADSASYGTGAGGFLASIFNNHSGEAQLGMMALLFAIVLLVVIVLLLIVKQSNSRSSKSSQSSDLKQIKSGKQQQHHQQSLMAATISSGGKFANSAASNNNHQRGGGNMFADSEDDVDNAYEEDGRSSSVGSSSSCKKNPKVMVAAGDHLDGFIEHMRSGIINMDYHSMSPVVQFNNTMKNNQNHQTSTPSSTVHDHQMLYHIQQQQQAHLHHQQLLQQQQQQQQQLQHQQLHLQQLQLQQQPYLDTTDHHMMHHFPSASNASTLPCYYGNGGGGGASGMGGGGGGGAGTASMTTTTSDLSPSSGSGNTNFTATNGPAPPPTNLHPHYTMYVSYPE